MQNIKSGTLNCNYCQETQEGDIIYAKCVECESFEMCQDCQAHGNSVYPHEETHGYYIQRKQNEPIYDIDWSADEEIRQQEGIKKNGLGNWAEVASYVMSKNRIKCENHYIEIYLESIKAPYPDNTMMLPTQQTKQQQRYERELKQQKRKEREELENSRYRALQYKYKVYQKNSIGSQVGYNAHRRELEIEYDNDAELLIADLEFRPNDTDWEKDLKLRILQVYNARLEERDARRDFILSRGQLLKRDHRRNRVDKEIYSKLRPFSRFLQQEEWEEFVQGHIAELRLRQRIEQLQTYRLNGIKTFAEGAAFDIDRARHSMEFQSAQFLTVPISSSILNTSQGTLSTSDDIQVPPQIPSNAAVAPFLNITSSSTATNTNGIGTNTTGTTTNNNNNNSNTNNSNKKDTTNPSTNTYTETNTQQNPQILASLSAPRNTQINSQNFDIYSMEGIELLSQAERELCIELLLIPQHYLVIKDRLIREAISHGALSYGRAKQLVRIDVTANSKIVDFFVSHGWITTPSSQSPNDVN